MQPDEEVRALVRSRKKIQAIKLYRERSGAGLREAKDVIDALARGEDPAGPAAAPAPEVEIDALIRAGQKIQAIKLYRERSGAGLREAKDVIDARFRELGVAETRAGCFIATAACGSDQVPEVLALRRFRDERLLPTAAGRLLVGLYYRLSPPLAREVARRPRLRSAIRRAVVWLARQTGCRADIESGP